MREECKTEKIGKQFEIPGSELWKGSLQSLTDSRLALKSFLDEQTLSLMILPLPMPLQGSLKSLTSFHKKFMTLICSLRKRSGNLCSEKVPRFGLSQSTGAQGCKLPTWDKSIPRKSFKTLRDFPRKEKEFNQQVNQKRSNLKEKKPGSSHWRTESL